MVIAPVQFERLDQAVQEAHIREISSELEKIDPNLRTSRFLKPEGMLPHLEVRYHGGRWTYGHIFPTHDVAVFEFSRYDRQIQKHLFPNPDDWDPLFDRIQAALMKKGYIVVNNWADTGFAFNQEQSRTPANASAR